jgi:hypothetical protein
MTESLRQLNASNRANELTESNIAMAMEMMKKMPAPYNASAVVFQAVLQSLATIYSAEMTSSGYK